jgi:DNA-binding transcriptional LysR family regulator
MHPLHTTSWDWIKSFVAVAEHGSVLAAAQHLETNPATVSRQIASLEQSLGVELFVRSRQGMRPTLPAMQFLEPARAMHAAMHQLSLGAAAKDEKVQGVVRISVSVTLAHFVLPELLDVFRSQHTGIHFEVTATDSVGCNCGSFRIKFDSRQMRRAKPEGLEFRQPLAVAAADLQ